MKRVLNNVGVGKFPGCNLSWTTNSAVSTSYPSEIIPEQIEQSEAYETGIPISLVAAIGLRIILSLPGEKEW
jgi:hypothetical protein